MKSLFEYQHPYYMTEGNYFASSRDGCHFNFKTLEDFLAEWGEADLDYNRVHRWDLSEDTDENDQPLGTWTFKVYYVLQRKANLISCHVTVNKQDEDQIKEFLKPHAEANAKLWEGI